MGLPNILIKAVKGTRDLLPPATVVWNRVEDAARSVFRTFNYRDIRTLMILLAFMQFHYVGRLEIEHSIGGRYQVIYKPDRSAAQSGVSPDVRRPRRPYRCRSNPLCRVR